VLNIAILKKIFENVLIFWLCSLKIFMEIISEDHYMVCGFSNDVTKLLKIVIHLTCVTLCVCVFCSVDHCDY